MRLSEQALQLSRQVNDRLNASMFLQALAWIAAEEHARSR
ncbi:protein kinase/ LuxR family transcriptional regulator [Rhodococcus opacus M213]|uniref:Protein kinase/ LuxR family transcriptional regulator n=1 Tax=Rhodococcus opacus M213 TaxID=1129896 RepID=K8XKV5_RHOOP|nr:protein kinase/ LuxR family transcriptional regulator [Rhodococcus opacus M213]